MKRWYSIMLTYASAFAMIVAVSGAGARSGFIFHEPKVPAKLHMY